jgi:two-component system, chemotaxis family, sensor kinase CheA
MPAKKQTPSTKTDSNISELLETIAEQAVMADVSDLPGLAHLCHAFAALAEEATSSKTSEICIEAMTKAATLVENIILQDSLSPEKDLEIATRTITALQATINNGSEAEFPPELGLQSSNAAVESKESGAATESTKKTNESKAAEAANTNTSSSSTAPDSSPNTRLDPDDELYTAFIEQQRSVLPEIDEAILAFENDGDVVHIATLKRILHTMKGEAGCCGFADVETLCHKVEDYFADLMSDSGLGISADLLFQVKDWLEKALESYSAGQEPLGLNNLLAELKAGSDAKQEEEALGGEALEAAVKDSAATDVAKTDSQHDPIQISDPDLAGDFVAESQEHFDIADENLLILEEKPDDKDAVNAVFRAFHTIKGVCGFIGLPPIGNLAHRAENLLDDVRKEKRQFAGSVVDVTFKGLDMLKTMIADLSNALTNGTDFRANEGVDGVMDELERVLAGEEIDQGAEDRSQGAGVSGQVSAGKEESQEENERPTSNTQLPTSNEASATPQASSTPAPAPETATTAAAAPAAKTVIRSVMKVDAEKIDLMLDTIGELVIAESMVSGSEEIKSLNSLALEKNLGLLSKITGQLQDLGMSMRLVPISGTFKKMARLVRDLAKKSGKTVQFSMHGEDTEIDKGMIDKLGDPLVHMIRNSMDHGLEDSGEERVATGKSAAGHVSLKAFHQGGSIHIQIIDDGKGLDRKAIVEKAISKGLISSERDMTDQQVFSLIFEAGFSTAQKITEVSGRGVGMDVVRRNIESLRGKILIESAPNQGSTFTIVLPLTTAIIDGMLTSVGKEVYVIPTLSIVQSFRPKEGDISTVTGRGQMISFRGGLLPLFTLSSIFNIEGANASIYKSTVVVIEESGNRSALVVDELLGQRQTVIKSVGESLGKVQGVSGASIMSDGKPGLILDIGGVVALATSATEGNSTHTNSPKGGKQ